MWYPWWSTCIVERDFLNSKDLRQNKKQICKQTQSLLKEVALIWKFDKLKYTSTILRAVGWGFVITPSDLLIWRHSSIDRIGIFTRNLPVLVSIETYQYWAPLNNMHWQVLQLRVRPSQEYNPEFVEYIDLQHTTHPSAWSIWFCYPCSWSSSYGRYMEQSLR